MTTTYEKYCEKFFNAFFRNLTSTLREGAMADVEVLDALFEQYSWEGVRGYSEQPYKTAEEDTRFRKISDRIPDCSRLTTAMTPTWTISNCQIATVSIRLF